MYLKSIKVAGFKSFADLQVVHFKDPFTCIVGPNGCGKSNIIDAVKWVIGESSAKNLRGTSLTDVIFNGSTSRKPQGMAKVELVFDNSQGRLGGQWSAFKEISLSRVLYRDGQSSYYLNQTRCRRKDIIDLFLGTGLGPRSYAIIEQGMVNKFIDAKPQEMRLQIEEASGVSKYKEKRKETYSKLQEAEENLEKLEHTCREIDKRVQLLKNQAEQATKYQTLKENWASVRSDMYAVMWKNASGDFEKANNSLKLLKQQLSELSEQYQSFQIKNAHCFKDLEAQEQRHLGLEHDCQNHVLELKDLQLKWQQYQDKLTYINKDIERDNVVCDEIDKSLSQIEQKQSDFNQDNESLDQLEELKGAYESLKATVTEQKDACEKAQLEYQNLLKLKQAPQSQAEVIKSQVSSLEQQVIQKQKSIEMFESDKQTLIARQSSYQEKLSSLELKPLEQECLTLSRDLDGCEIELEEHRAKKLELEKEKISIQQEHKHLQSRVDKLQKHIDKHDKKPLTDLHQNLGSYQTLFKDHHPKDDVSKQLVQLLGSCELISVEKSLSLSDLKWTSSRKVQICWGEKSTNELFDADVTFPSSFNNYIFLNNWDDLEQAYEKLKTQQVLVLPNGALLGTNWLIPAYSEDTKSRAQCVLEQQEAQASLVALGASLKEHQCNYDAVERAIKALLQKREELKKALSVSRQKLNNVKIDSEKLQLQLQHIGQSLTEKKLQFESFVKEVRHAQGAIADKRDKLNELVLLIENQESSLEQSEVNLKSVLAKLKELECEQELAHKAYRDEYNLCEQYKRDQVALTKEKERYFAEKQRYTLKAEELKRQVSDVTPKLKSLDKEILELNNKIDALHVQKSESEKKLEEIKKLNYDLTKTRKMFERDISSKKEQIHKAEILWEKTLVSQNHVKEQIFDIGLDFESLKRLTPADTKEQLKRQLSSLDGQIDSLGAINLNACAEYEQESARLLDITKQCEDIDSSCKILKGAVDSLDKEIVQTYQNTFSALKSSFAELFPKLFGGGQASLKEVEIEGQSEKGVVVFAQPPGKKNATLSALSGGEKALTAAALVFSFFHLNPAPFCLMDEIDAPLDDSNTARLANMLNYLSQSVQCLCVTHSKITMERSHALYGVTMREPGVSRLVSVDLKKAETMIS